jgi:hypothetical protein
LYRYYLFTPFFIERVPSMDRIHTFLLVALLGISACASTHPRQNPTGRLLPEIEGSTLDGTQVLLPRNLAGGPAVLLVGYKQRSQFDIDRWLLGMEQASVSVRRYELPTIPGLLPRLWSGRIDAGMRSGIPEEDWSAVITVYRDADILARFLGNENPLPARVVLLDQEGRVAFFHDEGYSVATLMRLREAIERLGSAP